MTTEEEKLDGIDRRPQPWWSSDNQARRIRERRIDAAVRRYMGVGSNREHLLGSMRGDGEPCPDCVRLLRAEYRRIVEREEIQESVLDATR
jgi:hypothetical protein